MFWTTYPFWTGSAGPGQGAFKSAVAGVLIAIPPILSIVTQKDLPAEMQLMLSGISVVAVILAAATVVFGFETIAKTSVRFW